MIKILSALLLLLTLTACQTGGIAYMFHEELQKAPISTYDTIPSSKAVVVMSSTSGGDLRFAKNQDISRSSNSQFRAWLTSRYENAAYAAFVVDPGIYHLARIWISNGEIRSHPFHGGIDIGTNNYTYMSFDVSAGDVKYIGNITFNIEMPFMFLKKSYEEKISSRDRFEIMTMPFITVQIDDRFKDAQRFLANEVKRPELKLTKGLARIGTNDHLKRAQMIIAGMGDRFTRNDYWKARAIFDREVQDRVK
ncbi:MAG: hypothetical protein HWE34_07225 [Methylocystaceae bacterium]|nr:hypothetical protein [Methylocystaceae bacterium]